MFYRPRYFTLDELADPVIIKARGARTWELLQVPALIVLDQLREKFGEIVVNGEYRGHLFTESGLRLHETDTGAKWSMHKYGGAFDCKFKRTTPLEVFAYIMAHPSEFQHITVLENVYKTVSWLHYDCRNHDRGGVWVVEPT